MKQAEYLAGVHLGVETLEPRNRDSLDFHECSVRGLYSLIDAAYKMGKQSNKKKAVKKVGTPWKTGIWA